MRVVAGVAILVLTSFAPAGAQVPAAGSEPEASTPTPAEAEAPAGAETPTAASPSDAATPPAETPAGSDTLDALDDVLTEPLVENQPATSAAATSSALNPRISLVGTFAGAYVDGTPTGAGGHEPVESGLLQQEAELAIQAPVDPYFNAEAYLAFHQDGVEIEEAFVRTTALPVVSLQGGIFRSQFGRHNRRHLDSWRFVDQPIIARQVLGAEGLSVPGAALDFLAPFGPSLRLRLEVLDVGEAHAHGAEEEVEEAGDDHDAEAGADHGFEDRMTVMFRPELGFGLGPATSLLIGASGLVRPLADEEVYVVGGDVYLRYLPAESGYFAIAWQTEYMAQIDEDATSGGLYSELAFRLTQRFELAGRFDLVGLPEGELPKEIGGALAPAFLPTEFSRIRLQAGAAKREDSDDPVLTAMLQVQFNIGPHGGHQF